MSNPGDLDKPLGLKPKTSSSGPKHTHKFGLTVIMSALIVGAGFAGYFWSSMTQKPVGQAATASIAENTVLPADLIRNTTDIDEIKTSAIAVQEPQREELKPIEPTGFIQEPKSKRRKPASQVRQKQVLAHLPDSQLIERGATGVIPKKSPDGLRPMDVYSRQPDTEGNFGVARVVIIVGGLGISQTSTQKAIRELPGSVTLAFAPYGNSRLRWMQEARKRGHELLLQVPMEPYGYPQNNPGTHTLVASNSVDENLTNLHWAMSRLTNYVGIMNYQGGKLLADSRSLKPIFDEISSRGLLFLEDGSIRNSAGKLAAGRSLMPFAKAHLQIDSVRTRSAIAEKLNKLADEAKRTGLAIGVANAFPESISMISDFANQAKKHKLEITPVSAVVIDPLNPR